MSATSHTSTLNHVEPPLYRGIDDSHAENAPSFQSADALITTLLVKNIHCPSCVAYAEDVLRPLPNISKTDVSIIHQSIRVEHTGGTRTAQTIARELIDAAFEVQHALSRDSSGKLRYEFNVPTHPSRNLGLSWPFFLSKTERKHMENCSACRAKLSDQAKPHRKPRRWANIARVIGNPDKQPADIEKSFSEPSLSSTPNPEGKGAMAGANDLTQEKSEQPQRWGTTISIQGMTCAVCVGTITELVKPIDGVESVDINLISNSGMVKFAGPKEKVDIIVEAIEDGGYGASVIETRLLSPETVHGPPEDQATFRLTLSISDMTCGACSSAITRALRDLPFISSVNIDPISNRAVVEFEGEHREAEILQQIDDTGYGATVLQLEQPNVKTPLPKQGTKEREISIQIKGMYCEHCPRNIETTLQSKFGKEILISQLPTLSVPRITIKYMPTLPRLTVRRLVATIGYADEAFSASVYHPPSDVERSREMRYRDRKYILLRLAFTAIVAIPTFIIAIVFMSLVPKKNNSRIWLETPIWVGNVSREEWALFIMTTPVMFFGADMFHRRAAKEIKTLWRRNSKVPILRRFYRFGSMNLLISLGTSVAYLSSVAVLAMDATASSSEISRGHSSDTYFDSVTFLTLFLLIGRFLEAYSKAKTGDAVGMLSNLRPSEAFFVEAESQVNEGDEDGQNESTSKIPVDLLEVGDTVNVPHGSSPPTDGIINQDGNFLFDESSLTGESKPVKKILGDQVFAGSVNVSQPVRVAVTELDGTSMLDKIVAVVREGQGKRAPIERIADLITGYFAPVITLVAIITWVVWLALGESGVLPRDWLDVEQGGWAFWSLEFAIAVFVVACPCGIGLAAPTALYVGGGLAAQNHILVQGGGEAFQEASKMDVIVFDKTGTLTEGRMQVTDFELLRLNEQDQDESAVILTLSKAMEESSTHPIATAIASFCEKKLHDMPPVRIKTTAIEEVPGNGMRGVFVVESSSPRDARKVEEVKYEAAIGNSRLLNTIRDAGENKDDLEFYLNPLLTRYQTLGQSTAIFSIRRLSASEGRETPVPPFNPVAVFSITDPLRPTTASVLETLQHQHNLEVHMCTGDNATTARSVALQLGIPIANVRANVLPQDKAAYITSLQTSSGSRRIVAFVGDGTNDTPALSAADVSIAMSSGSDVAITAASFILLNSDLETILKLVKLARRVFRRVKMNFAWAAVYNVCLVPVAAGVTYPAGQWRLGPVWASAAMAASSVSVVLSSLALRLPEPEFGGWKRNWLKTRKE